ncbi:unnamed protein product [Pleuronectes platessa]|uniref:Uncharacterized protein n=1 Tax=Pleuronectes platessa TaxID=8262 RepID=A0A9N7YSH7_PLEPL|nr:unnamed protein product [Pleuronectes platessa]
MNDRWQERVLGLICDPTQGNRDTGRTLDRILVRTQTSLSVDWEKFQMDSIAKRLLPCGRVLTNESSALSMTQQCISIVRKERKIWPTRIFYRTSEKEPMYYTGRGFRRQGTDQPAKIAMRVTERAKRRGRQGLTSPERRTRFGEPCWVLVQGSAEGPRRSVVPFVWSMYHQNRRCFVGSDLLDVTGFCHRQGRVLVSKWLVRRGTPPTLGIRIGAGS